MVHAGELDGFLWKPNEIRGDIGDMFGNLVGGTCGESWEDLGGHAFHNSDDEMHQLVGIIPQGALGVAC